MDGQAPGGRHIRKHHTQFPSHTDWYGYVGHACAFSIKVVAVPGKAPRQAPPTNSAPTISGHGPLRGRSTLAMAYSFTPTAADTNKRLRSWSFQCPKTCRLGPKFTHGLPAALSGTSGGRQRRYIRQHPGFSVGDGKATVMAAGIHKLL